MGRHDIGDCLPEGLAAYPDSMRRLVIVGASIVALRYESVNRLVAVEVFELNTGRPSNPVWRHYLQNPFAGNSHEHHAAGSWGHGIAWSPRGRCHG